MANYASVAGIKASYGPLNFAQLTADSGTAPNDTAILNAVTDQSRLMDGYLMGRYTCPITGPDEVLAVLSVHCTRLALYSLFQGRLMADAYQSILTDRDITIAWLRDVSMGKTSIPGQLQPNALLPSANVVGGSMTKVFGDGDMLGQYGSVNWPGPPYSNY